MVRFILAIVLLSALAVNAAEPEKTKSRTALQPFQSLIGTWKGTGVPEGTRDERQKGFWSETIAWEWQFKGSDGWIKGKLEKSPWFETLEIHATDKPNRFRLIAVTPAKTSLTFEGDLQDQKLILERTDSALKETQRLTIRLLHANRITYQYDVKPDGKTQFVKKYQVGATKEGEPFASNGSSDPECIVSGGKGTIAVSYQGKTYYVCCSGCRDEFKANPEKYIKELESKKK